MAKRLRSQAPGVEPSYVRFAHDPCWNAVVWNKKAPQTKITPPVGPGTGTASGGRLGGGWAPPITSMHPVRIHNSSGGPGATVLFFALRPVFLSWRSFSFCCPRGKCNVQCAFICLVCSTSGRWSADNRRSETSSELANNGFQDCCFSGGKGVAEGGGRKG
jgi:hypothetical protein